MSNSQPTIAELDSALHTMLDENDALRAELAQLRDENKRLVDWINDDADALTTLQRTYLDPKTSTTDRIKAAASAIAFARREQVLGLPPRHGPASGKILPLLAPSIS